MELKRAGFVILNEENLKDAAEELAHGRGRILVAEKLQYRCVKEVRDVTLILFAKPLIDPDKLWLHTNRGSVKINGVDWQTGWENDRQYIFRPIPEPSEDPLVNDCSNLSDRLVTGPYEFSIGFQPYIGMNILFQNSVFLFIPNNRDLRPAFMHGLTHFLKQMKGDRQLLTEAAERAADYAMDDLKTGKVFRKNVAAGMEADAILGM